ncbi:MULTISPECIES: A24 family peptidase [Novosphingobium]|uniref:A24 family peptidase n=1 Tax=unclassified Novosphingobium TaxID=2644732 RepID=UPI0006C8A901|nr:MULTISPECIES: prepilin peptidase [unclassified Novosphingobium]KPH59569.1 potassium:proton antiporter [Novosphingobium sp. ST904]MPS69162.1 potassium:proton antiporter [Novosphingobium sp.]TCM38016.1 prepilin peptidase CpaA [Novosphingobium sp. ST904]
MPGTAFSYALLLALAIALLRAAFTDIRRREIGNGLNLAIALAAPLWWWAAGFGWADIAWQIGLAAVTFALACVLFALRQMGGGDVKLLAALALWFVPASFGQLIVLMAMIGGGASIAMAAFNMERVPGEKLRDALGWLAALGWVWAAGAIVYALAVHRPVVSPERLSAIHAAVPQGWMLALAALAVAALFLSGFRHIMRRQKSRLPIPYGVAISAAALWVMGEQALSTSLVG